MQPPSDSVGGRTQKPQEARSESVPGCIARTLNGLETAEQGDILCGLILANWQRMRVRRCKCRFRTPILKRHHLKVKTYLDPIYSIFETSKDCTHELDVFNVGVGSAPGEPLEESRAGYQGV